MYYQFMDMYSGGDQKVGYDYIYIKADSEDAAADIFDAHFNQDPYAVACRCCGRNFAVCEIDEERVGEERSSIVIN